MSAFNPPADEHSEEAWLLIGRLCDGQASQQECDLLEKELQANERLRELFLAYRDVHATLLWRHQENLASELVPQTSRPTVSGSARPSAASMPGTIKPSLFAHAPFNSVLASTVLVAAVFYGSFALVAWNMRPSRKSTVAPTTEAEPARGGAQMVATIVDSKGCRWRDLRDSRRLSARSALFADEVLDIVSGSVSIKFAAGATVILDGPAKFRLVNEGKGYLDEGELLGKVPPAARGFTIDTREVRVVDLGTEFGVVADGDTRVEVFRGEVSLVPGLNLPGSFEPTRLVAGDARRITQNGSLVTVAPRREEFAGQDRKKNLRLPSPPQPTVVADDFEGRQLDDSKWSIQTEIPAGKAAVSIESGRLKLMNRGYLISRAQFIPAPERPLRITGTCRFCDPADMFQLITRSNGVAEGITGQVIQGLEVYVCWNDLGKLQFLSRGDPELLFEQTIIEGKLDVKPQMLLHFEMIDSSSNVSFTLQEVSNASNKITMRAKVTPSCKAYHVVLHNREREHSAAEHVLYVDELRIEQRASEDAAPIATGKGK